MSQEPPNSPTAAVPDGERFSAADLEALGVVRHVTETFTVGGFKYTNLDDAIAQARRTSAEART